MDVSFQALLDLYLRARNDARGNRPVTGNMLWRGSEIGMCLRRQMLRARDTERTVGFDALSLRRFAVGDITGWWLKRVFEDLGILVGDEIGVYDETLRAGGNIDLVIGGPIQPVVELEGWRLDLTMNVRETLRDVYGDVLPLIGVELKTKNSRSFWYAKKNNKPVAGDHQLQQAAFYRLLNECAPTPMPIERWIVASVSKDDMTIAEDGVHRGHVAAVEDRLRILNEHYDAGTWPPCECVGTWQENYCPYAHPDEGVCCVIPETIPEGQLELL